MFTKMLSKVLIPCSVKILVITLMMLFITSARSDVITKNEVEDLNLIISQFVEGQPNVLFIMDVSGSMGRSFGGSQIGKWTLTDSRGTLTDCERAFCDSFDEDCPAPPSENQDRLEASHCAENTANLTVCGSIYCKNGTCDTQEEFDGFLSCIENHVPGFTTSDEARCIYNAACGNANDVCGETASNCNTSDEREAAAAALEAAAGLTTCASHIAECSNESPINGNPACDTEVDYQAFSDCMQTLQDITINQTENCTGGTTNCDGTPAFGSNRLDVTLGVIFDLLDADNSLDDALCIDDGNSNNDLLYNGTSPISCKDYMYTPFRNVRQIVRNDGSPPSKRNLPIANNSGPKKLINYLTDSDAEELNVRLRPLTYSGLGRWNGCTSNNTFRTAQGGFAGASETSFKNVWKFFRRLEPWGGTPLAYVLGFDDSNKNGSKQGNVINKDALGVYRVELKTDPAIECRPEFVIVLTDGEDTCSGDCDATPWSCLGAVTTNANRRSTLQAVSNLRTYYVRNPVKNQGKTYKKEIMTFVIGLGIPEEDKVARRTINTMALVGGTHTDGIIRHTDPNGLTVGTLDIDDLLPDVPGIDPFKDIATVKGIDSANPENAHLQGCGIGHEDEYGSCVFQSNTIFDNAFFDSGDPFPDENDTLEGFAFFPQDAHELREALSEIFGFIESFSTAGVSPTAPQSSSSVALRDRIFVSILTPITTERLWQGRLALYGFVDDPENEGNKIVIKDPEGTDVTTITDTDTLIDQFGIFDPDDGTLVKEKAQKFHWEAGKLLAERNLSTHPRSIYTVNPNFSDTSSVDITNFGTIRYIGEKTEFNESLPPEAFGISDSDVVSPIPEFCTQSPPDGYADCNAGPNDCDEDITNEDCRTCVKNCLRDKIVDFIKGNTEIPPVGDPLGSPGLAGDTEINFETIGTNCPNDETGEGNFDTCSVRLGDIFHSDPVVVGSPSALFFDTGFPSFAKAFRKRSSVVYVGANDAGFHAFHAGEFVEASQENPQTNPFTGAEVEVPFFDEGTGWEMFFYIPPTFLPDAIAPTSPINKDPKSHLHETFPSIAFAPDYRFGDLKTFVIDNLVQRSFFDGSPLIFDAFIDGFDNDIAPDSVVCSLSSEEGGSVEVDGAINPCGKEWHTIAVAGYRNGGGAYTALDITNPKCVVGGSPEMCTSVEKYASTVSDGSFEGSGPDYPKHLWTLFDRDFGNTWSKPAPGRVRMITEKNGKQIIVDRWLIFVGGGLDPVDTDPTDGVSFGNAFYAIDAATGKIVYKFHPTRPFPETIPDNNIRQAMVCEMSSSPGVFDINNDGYVDIAYAGDTCGRLWRFDVSTPIVDTGNDVTQTGMDGNAVIEASDWEASIAFCANTEAECGNITSAPLTPQTNLQPIYFPPTLVIDDLGRRHIIFNTGSRRDPSNVELFGKLFNIIDHYVPAFLAGGPEGTATGTTTGKKTEDDFSTGEVIEIIEQAGLGEDSAQQFTTQGGSSINNQGEFMVVFPDNVSEVKGEKGIGTPIVINRTLVFTTFAPDAGLETNPCINKTGAGRVFALDYLSGEPALIRVPGAQALLSGSTAQKNAAAGLTVSEGIPSPAKLTFGARGSVIMTVAFAGGPSAGGAQFLVWELPPLPSRTQTLFWQEIM